MEGLIKRFRNWRKRNDPKYSAVIGGPRSFFPGISSSGSENNSTTGTCSGTEYLGRELSDKVYGEASDLRMKLAPEVSARGGDLIVRIEVYNKRPNN